MIRMVLPEVMRLAITQLNFLQRHFEIVAAKNGAEGLEIYQKNHDQVKLILSDFEMPVLNGPKMSQLIREYEREIRKRDAVTIVGLTGHDSDEIKDKGLLSGMNKVLSKPPTM